MRIKEENWLFPTPVKIYDLSEFINEEVNVALQAIGYATNDLVDGIRGDKDPSKIPELKSLYDTFQECIDDFSDFMGIKKSLIYESWMNILGMNGSVGVHRHFDSVVSGAYYPYVDKGSAPLVFVSSIDGFRMIDVPASLSDRGTPYNSNVHNIYPVNGQLVLFPGWVQHYVPPNKTDMRITLSFNTKY